MLRDDAGLVLERSSEEMGRTFVLSGDESP